MSGKKHKTIDDYLHELRGKNLQQMTDVLSHYDEHNDEHNQKSMMLNTFAPAMDDFYKAFVDKIDSEFGQDDKAALEKNKEGVKKAVVAGLKKYLEKAMPSALKSIEGIKDEEKQYETLINFMDKHFPMILDKNGRPGSLKDTIEDMIKEKKKVDDLKYHFMMNKAVYAHNQKEVLNSLYTNHLFQTYTPDKIVAHIQPEIEKTYEIGDKAIFANLERHQALQLHDHLTKGRGIEDIEKYGLKKKSKD